MNVYRSIMQKVEVRKGKIQTIEFEESCRIMN